MKKKIMCIFGTRPEAIKMAPVIKELQKRRDIFETDIVLTEQHQEMLDQMMELLHSEEHYPEKLRASIRLDIMEENQSLHHIISKTISELKPIFDEKEPDLVLVQGDTTSALGATLASFYSKIPIGHIEAGLRSGNWDNPYPEEANRILIDNLSDLHFAPLYVNFEYLYYQHTRGKHIFITGNTVIDALQDTLNRAYLYKNPYLRHIDFKKRIIILTVHRRETWGEPLRDICQALKKYIPKYPGVEIVCPVHPNPAVKNIVYEILGNQPQIHLFEPLDYCDSVKLINDSYAILTDSGGIVEEASYVGTPVLILREITERQEAVMAKSAKLIGTSKKKIIREINKFLNDKIGYEEMAVPRPIFGDGKASERIVWGIEYYFEITKRRPEDFKGDY